MSQGEYRWMRREPCVDEAVALSRKSKVCECEDVDHAFAGWCSGRVEMIRHTEYGSYWICQECRDNGHMPERRR